MDKARRVQDRGGRFGGRAARRPIELDNARRSFLGAPRLIARNSDGLAGGPGRRASERGVRARVQAKAT